MQSNTSKNVLWNTFGSIAYLACQWLLTVAVVRISSNYEYAGYLSLAMSYSNIFIPIALYKIRSFQVSDINNQFTSSQYIGFRIVTTAVGFGLVLFYSVVTCRNDAIPSVICYCLYKVIEVVIDVFYGIDQKGGDMSFCGISMLLRGLLSLLSFSLVLMLTGSMTISILSMCVICVPVLFLDIYWASKFDSVVPEFNFAAIRALFLRCFPAVLGVACCAFVTSASRQMLASMLGNSVLGIYSSVCSPAAIVQAGALNAYAPLLVVFAMADLEESRKHFNQLLIKVAAVTLAIAFACLFGCSIIGQWALCLLFGPSIIRYSYLLYGAVISSLATALIGVFSDLTIVRRSMSSNLVGNLIALVLVVPLSYLFIKNLGANGVSVAISLAYLIGCLVMLPSLIRK